MKLVIFAVADEGHFVTDGAEYGKVIRFADSDKLATLNELTDEEYYELFPDARPVEVTEDVPEDGEIIPEVPTEVPEASEPTDTVESSL